MLLSIKLPIGTLVDMKLVSLNFPAVRWGVPSAWQKLFPISYKQVHFCLFTISMCLMRSCFTGLKEEISVYL